MLVKQFSQRKFIVYYPAWIYEPLPIKWDPVSSWLIENEYTFDVEAQVIGIEVIHSNVGTYINPNRVARSKYFFSVKDSEIVEMPAMLNYFKDKTVSLDKVQFRLMSPHAAMHFKLEWC